MESIRPRRGFTLIELLVVLAIITIVTAVVLTSQSSFNKTLVLANTAYDVALTLRYAETYGISSQTFMGAANTGYGLDFSSGSPGSFILFADTYPPVGSLWHNPNNGDTTICHPAPTYDATGPSAIPGDCAYESGPGKDGTVQVYTLGNGITIDNFCAYQQTAGWSCEKANEGANNLQSLDIVFSRPNPTPLISENGKYNSEDPAMQACIALISQGGIDRYVSVSESGEISASATGCGPGS